MNPLSHLLMITCAGLLVSCAATVLPSQDLIGARQAYARASALHASQVVPVEVRLAREALVLAETSFQDDPESSHTQRLAMLAYRKAKLAEALALTTFDKPVNSQSVESVPSTKTGAIQQ